MTPHTVLIAALLLIVLATAISFYNSNKKVKLEGFDKTGSEFVPAGSPRYDLSGKLLPRIYVGDYYVRPDRQIKINGTDGFVWESNLSPKDQEYSYSDKCMKVDCPVYSTSYDGYTGPDANIIYDTDDVCWKCDNGCFDTEKLQTATGEGTVKEPSKLNFVARIVNKAKKIDI